MRFLSLLLISTFVLASGGTFDFVRVRSGTLPGSCSNGEIRFDSSDSTFQFCQGGSFEPFGIDSPLTGFVSGAGTVSAADSLLQAIQKLDGNILLVHPSGDDFLQLQEQASAPSTPSSGFKKIYADTDGVVYTVDSSGNVVELGSGGAGAGAYRNRAVELELNWDGETGDTTDWTETGSGALSVINTASGAIGVSSVSFDASADGDVADFGPVTMSTIEGNNCLISFWYKGFDTNITAQVWDGTNVLNETASLPAATNWAPNAELSFVCPDDAADEIYLRFSADADAAIGYVDNIWIGQNYLVGSVADNEFSAQVSSGGTISAENKDFLSSCSGTSCTFTSGVFSAAPNCVALAVGTTSASCKVSTTDTTATFFCNSDSGATVTSSANKVLMCQRSTDYVQTAVKADQTNRPWTSYTPTFTGFGTVSTSDCDYKRQGEDMIIRCTFTAGTSTATEARISLPGSFVAKSTLPTISLAGDYVRSASSSTYFRNSVLIEPSVGYLTFGNQTSSADAITKANGNSIAASGTTVSITARIPIEGWNESYNAPLIKQSVVTSADAVWAHESAAVSSAGAVSRESGDWINGDCAVTDTSLYTCTYTTTHPQSPNCQVTLVGTGAREVLIITETTSSIAIRTLNSAGSNSAGAFNLSCDVPR